MSGPGQPSKFPVGQEPAIKMLYLKGCTDAELAEAFSVDERTVNNWKKQRPEFFQSLKDWKHEADSQVEQALYKRALGAKVIEQKAIYSDGESDVVETIKEYPPDTAACVVWLANRQPDKWKKDPGQTIGGAQVVADALKDIADKLPT